MALNPQADNPAKWVMNGEPLLAHLISGVQVFHLQQAGTLLLGTSFSPFRATSRLARAAGLC